MASAPLPPSRARAGTLLAHLLFVGGLPGQTPQLKDMHGSSFFCGRLRSGSVLAAGSGLFLIFAPVLPAAIIGTNPPVQPLSLERIAALPHAQQSVWKTYLKN